MILLVKGAALLVHHQQRADHLAGSLKRGAEQRADLELGLAGAGGIKIDPGALAFQAQDLAGADRFADRTLSFVRLEVERPAAFAVEGLIRHPSGILLVQHDQDRKVALEKPGQIPG